MISQGYFSCYVANVGYVHDQFQDGRVGQHLELRVDVDVRTGDQGNGDTRSL